MIDFFKYLSPIYYKIDDIADLEKYSPSEKEFQIELPHLKETIGYLDSQVRSYIKTLKELSIELEKYIEVIEAETGDDKDAATKDYNKLLSHIKNHVNKTNLHLQTLSSPYFGKLVFKNSETKRTTTTYIGKTAVFNNNDLQLLVSDWRSPIANLYYEEAGPTKDCKFQTPAGIQKGDLLEKKQFIINNGRFNYISDIKSGNKSMDAFLEIHLRERTGKQLEDIVATIQRDQNKIIREEKDIPVIIQGVAGSGKTTILLHKIAYLIFAYKEELDQSDFLVIAPNKTFIEYISNVLPTLGVYNIQINTFLFWAFSILNWDKKYLIYNESDLSINKFKGSIQYYHVIKQLFEAYENKILNNIHDPLREKIKTRYYQLKETTNNISFKERLEIAIEYAFNQRLMKEADFSRKKYIRGRKTKILNQLNLKSAYSTYRILLHDKTLLENIDKTILPSNWDKIVKNTLIYLQPSSQIKRYALHDLAPLIWLQSQLDNTLNFQKELILADEAQDLSEFQIFVLGLFVKKQNLILAGDIAQGIKKPTFIHSWAKVENMLKDELGFSNISYHELSKCYRTTIEIIDYIHRNLKSNFLERFTVPQAVIRHGEPVKEIATNNWKDKKSKLENLLTELSEKNKGGTIAVLTKKQTTANQIKDYLENTSLKFQIANDEEENYTTGIHIMTIENAKGLEFDSVILADYNEKYYAQLSDQKLLYVGLTRALHRLIVLRNS